MRVMGVCLPSPGHANPLVPLVSALADQGCDVLVASGAAVRAIFEPAGAAFAEAGRGYDAWFSQLRARTRGVPGDGLPPEHIERYFVPRLFAEIAADDMIDSLLDHGRRFAPDVVLVESMSFAAFLAAQILDVPAIHHQVGVLQDPLVVGLAADAVAPLWRSFGLEPPGDAGLYPELTLRTVPATLDRNAVPHGDVLELRPVPLPRARSHHASGRPLVHLTLGTIMNSDVGVFRAVIDGLAEEPVDTIVTVGRNNDTAMLGAVPANTRVMQYVEHNELLPRCAAVVHHGGAGTMLSCCAHGLPQVVIPQGGDQFRDAALLEAAGIARTLLPGQVTAAAARDAVRTVLREPAYAAAAKAAADDIARMPSAEDVAAQLRSRYG